MMRDWATSSGQVGVGYMTGFAARPVLETGPLLTTSVQGIAPGFGGSYASVLVDGQNPTLSCLPAGDVG